MRKIEIDPVVEARVLAVCGRRHVFDTPDLARTAHLVVDLQNGFMEIGAPVEIPMAREIVDSVNRMSRAAREGGGLNVFLRYIISRCFSPRSSAP